jgi:UDP-N-acetylmuramoylalanine--D-glutamate ligase
LVGELAGVRYINDSKATNSHAAHASLSSFDSVVWILGGLLKGVDISELIGQFVPRLRGAVIIGIDRAEIRNAFALLAPQLPIREIEEGDQVMQKAVTAAASLAVAGDVVLLAPAAASMDQFLNYQERGELFRQAVKSLGGDSR